MPRDFQPSIICSFHAAEADILNEFTNDPMATNRISHLEAIVADIKSRVTKVRDEWVTGGYSTTFKNAKGTDVGSSLGQLVNSYARHYEVYFRDGKIGIPVGIRSLGVSNPGKKQKPITAAFPSNWPWPILMQSKIFTSAVQLMEQKHKAWITIWPVWMPQIWTLTSKIN